MCHASVVETICYFKIFFCNKNPEPIKEQIAICGHEAMYVRTFR